VRHVSNRAGRGLRVVFAGTLGLGISLVNACLATGSQPGGGAGTPALTPQGWQRRGRWCVTPRLTLVGLTARKLGS
jgi:hypothetical protein